MGYKYIKNRIIAFILIIALCVCFVYIPNSFNKTEAKSDETVSTCWLACFIDDTNYTYKTQVIYSGKQLEGTRVSRFFKWETEDGNRSYKRELDKDEYPVYYEGETEALIFSDVNERFPLIGYSNPETGFAVNPNNGSFSIDVTKLNVMGSLSYTNISDFPFDKLEGFHTPRPLSFPNMQYSANASDINRAYEVQDAIATDFMEALIFVNDGQSFDSVATLQETAFSLLTSSDGATLTNQFGNRYLISFSNGDPSYKAGYPKDDNGYAYYIKITDLKSDNSEEFCWKVKKGYAGCQNGDIMENGTINNLRIKSDISQYDTTYISWEHIYLEAGILYAENISYANQGDLFETDEAESVITKIFRRLLSGLTSSLQLYSIEDCIFNSGVRGSRAFVFGVYYDSWSYFVFLVYLIFMVIAVALVTLAVIRIIIKKLEGAISPSARYSMVEGIKDLLIALFVICISWLLIKFALMLNFRFVAIWRDYVAGKSLSDNASDLSSLAGVVYRFIFFIIRIYVNYVYILRSLVVPALIITAPLFIILYSFGEAGKKITGQWIRELLGNIFMQSIHAFVFGFILMASMSLRGIESIVICASIIPLTSVFRNVLQIGGDEILKTARGLTAGTVGAMGAYENAKFGVIGAGIEGATGLAGAGLGFANSKTAQTIGSGIGVVGDVAGAGFRATGGIRQAVLGAGLNGALGDGSGNGMIAQGLGTVSNSATGLARTEVGKLKNASYAHHNALREEEREAKEMARDNVQRQREALNEQVRQIQNQQRNEDRRKAELKDRIDNHSDKHDMFNFASKNRLSNPRYDITDSGELSAKFNFNDNNINGNNDLINMKNDYDRATQNNDLEGFKKVYGFNDKDKISWNNEGLTVTRPHEKFSPASVKNRTPKTLSAPSVDVSTLNENQQKTISSFNSFMGKDYSSVVNFEGRNMSVYEANEGIAKEIADDWKNGLSHKEIKQKHNLDNNTFVSVFSNENNEPVVGLASNIKN